MAGAFTVKLEGLAALEAALHELPKSAATSVMRRVLKQRAEPLAATATAKAPVRKGTLKRDIEVASRLTRRQRSQHRKDGPDDVEVYIGPSALPHGHLQEFGTRHHGAKAFMGPAWDRHHLEILAGIREDMWAEIEKTASRLARKAARTGKG
jgi:HK97 gp10 family phage protein